MMVDIWFMMVDIWFMMAHNIWIMLVNISLMLVNIWLTMVNMVNIWSVYGQCWLICMVDIWFYMVNNGFMRFHSHGDTQNSSFMTEHLIKIDDLGLSPLWGISIYFFLNMETCLYYITIWSYHGFHMAGAR